MADIRIISANGRPIRIGDQVAPVDGAPITVDTDDPLVRRHLDASRDEWLQLDDLGSGGTGEFVDKVLVGNWLTYTLPGNTGTRIIAADGLNVNQGSVQCRNACFVISTDDIAGSLASGQKLHFYEYNTLQIGSGAPITAGGTFNFYCGIRPASINGRWSSFGGVAPQPTTLYTSTAIDDGTNKKYEWSSEADLFVDQPTWDGFWFVPTFATQDVAGGTLNALGLGDGALLEISLYARVVDI